MGLAFIVDGFLEKKVVSRLCPGRPVRRTELNGKDVALEAMARVIGTLIETFVDDCFPIIVLVDREGRSLASEGIERELSRLLESFGHNTENLIISCPDRMIENWICAGSKTYNNSETCSIEMSYDDNNGKSKIKSELKRNGFSYRETTIGVDMFCKIDTTLARMRSASFRRFAEKMEPFCPNFLGERSQASREPTLHQDSDGTD